MGKLKNWLKDALSAYVVYVITGGFYSTGGGGEGLSAGSGHKAKKYGEQAYGLYTGHNKRQQERLAEEQQRSDFIEQQEQKKYALAQRRVQIDAQRERIGVGSRYRTSTRNQLDARGGGARRETLG